MGTKIGTYETRYGLRMRIEECEPDEFKNPSNPGNFDLFKRVIRISTMFSEEEAEEELEYQTRRLEYLSANAVIAGGLGVLTGMLMHKFFPEANMIPKALFGVYAAFLVSRPMSLADMAAAYLTPRRSGETIQK